MVYELGGYNGSSGLSIRNYGVRDMGGLPAPCLDRAIFPGEQIAGLVHGRCGGVHFEHLDDPSGRAGCGRRQGRHGDWKFRVDGLLYLDAVGLGFRPVLHQFQGIHAARVHGAALLSPGADLSGGYRPYRGVIDPYRHQPVRGGQGVREFSGCAHVCHDHCAFDLHGHVYGVGRTQGRGHDGEYPGLPAVRRRDAGDGTGLAGFTGGGHS